MSNTDPKSITLDDITSEMKQLKQDAKAAFSGIAGYMGIGGPDRNGNLFLYILDAVYTNNFPDDFKGAPLKKIITGDISAGDIILPCTKL